MGTRTEHEDVWVVVPMFNEARVVVPVVRALAKAFPNIVCVDDGSTDSSATLAASAGAVVLRHPDNLGQGAALQTGISYALTHPGTKFVVTFDADDQHSAADAVAMVAVARSTGVDVVLGSRFLGEASTGIPASRQILLRSAVRITRLMNGLALTDAHNGLRVFGRQAATSLHISLNGMAHASEILDQIAAARLTYSEHPVTVRYTDYARAKGQPNVNAINVAFDLLAARLRCGRRPATPVAS